MLFGPQYKYSSLASKHLKRFNRKIYEALNILTREETNVWENAVTAQYIPGLGLVFLTLWARIKAVKYHFHPEINSYEK